MDLFAVYLATKEAREICIKEKRPVLIEAMNYRGGHHSTSDDSTRYRSIDEIEKWKLHSPISRLKNYMKSKKWWVEEQETYLRDSERKNILRALMQGEEKVKHDPLSGLFDDVYAKDIPNELLKQRKELEKRLSNKN